MFDDDNEDKRKKMRKMWERIFNNFGIDYDAFKENASLPPYSGFNGGDYSNFLDEYLNNMDNIDMKKIVTISVEEGDDDGILQAIEILKSMLSTHIDEIELTEPTEDGGFDETFKEDWE